MENVSTFARENKEMNSINDRRSQWKNSRVLIDVPMLFFSRSFAHHFNIIEKKPNSLQQYIDKSEGKESLFISMGVFSK